MQLYKFNQDFGNHRKGDLVNLSEAEADHARATGLADPADHNLKPAVSGFRREIEHSIKKVLDNERPALLAELKTAMSTTTGTTGAFLLPQGNLRSVADPATLYQSFVLHSAQLYTTQETGPLTLPRFATAALFGGLQATPFDELAPPQDEATFAATLLKPACLGGYSLMSNAIHAANPRLLPALLPAVLHYAVDQQCLTGIAPPALGVLKSSAAINVSRQAANSSTLTDAAAMMGRLIHVGRPASRTWIVHPTARQHILRNLWRQTQDYSETGTAEINQLPAGPAIAWFPDQHGTPKLHLLGVPVEVSEWMSPLGTAGDIALVDWSWYAVVLVISDKHPDGLNIESSGDYEAAFAANSKATRFIVQFAAAPLVGSPITLQDGSNTVSPIVILN